MIDWKNTKNGDKVRIISNRSNHGWPTGSIVTIAHPTPYNVGKTNYLPCTDQIGSRWNVYADEVEMLEMNKEGLSKNLEETKAKIEKLTFEANDLIEKIQYLDENNLKVLNEVEYKVHKIVRLIKDNQLGENEQTKLIRHIIVG